MGASDDDPSGICTYAQTGAQFGPTQLWTALFTTPLMTAIQEMCARIALQSGGGLAEAIRTSYPKPVLYFCVSLLFLANTINLGADLGAMAASGQLLLGIPFILWLVLITAVSMALAVFFDYEQYSRVLRYLTLPLFAFVLVPLVSPVDWVQNLRNTLVPSFSFDRGYWLNLVAILGTTISPYMFFWQAAQEVEGKIKEGKRTRYARRGVSKIRLKWMRTDIAIGMVFSNVVMWLIIATTASTLFYHGITNVNSVTEAALALKPIAGNLAFVLFAAGIMGTGLLAVPVLASSAAYAIAEAFNLRMGIYCKLRDAPGFYGVIAFSMLIGFALNLVGVNPIKELYYTAVLNGIVAPPLLVMIMLISNNPKIMQNKVNGRLSNTLGWVTTIAMSAAAIALLVSFTLQK